MFYFRPNIPKNRFAFRVTIPYLQFKGKYDLDMRILLVQYKGKGPITGNFSKIYMVLNSMRLPK